MTGIIHIAAVCFPSIVGDMLHVRIIACENQRQLLFRVIRKVDPSGHLLRRNEQIEGSTFDVEGCFRVKPTPYRAEVVGCVRSESVVRRNAEGFTVSKSMIQCEVDGMDGDIGKNLPIARGAVPLTENTAPQ